MKITLWPLLPGLVMGLCFFAASARADTIYTYTGNPFTVLSGLDVCPPVCNISGSFTLASPPATNLPFAAIAPTAFSFTDGSITLTGGGSRFEVATDSRGDISFWDIALGGQVGPHVCASLDSVRDPTGTPQDNSLSASCSSGALTGVALVNANHGRWSSSTVPEPGNFILVGIGLLGIAGTVLLRNRHGLDLPTPPIRTKQGQSV
jgi:hypothetical protein